MSDDAFEPLWVRVQILLHAAPTVTNAALRSLTGVSYDRAIQFFNSAVKRGLLERRGRACRTHYVLKDGS